MMLGTLAQRPPVSPSRPDWVPADAIDHLDFVNGQYFAGAAPRPVTTLLGGPDFDPGSISGSGMHILPQAASPPYNLPRAIGALLSDIAAALPAGCTIVLDMDFVNEPYKFALFIGDDTNWNTSNNGFTVEAPADLEDFNTLAVGSGLSGTGVHKLAVTLNRDVGGGDFEYAWCADGAAAETQTVSYAIGWSVASVWIGSGGTGAAKMMDNVYFRTITVYPAKLPADLPALTS